MTKFLMQAAIAATVGAGCLVLESALSPAAMALSFGFSFINLSSSGVTDGTSDDDTNGLSPVLDSNTGDIGNVSDRYVTGIVRGLTEGTSAATSVEILSNTDGFGIGEYVGNPVANTWTVVDGSLQFFDFLAFGTMNSIPAVTDSNLSLYSESIQGAGLNQNSSFAPELNLLTTRTDIGVRFTPITAPTPIAAPTPIPTPALLPGLVGLGAAALRKRQTAA